MGSATVLKFPDHDDDPRRGAGKGSRRSKRNVNGEGTIRQRSDDRWEGRAYVITTDGREIRKSIYGKSWDEVHAKLTKLQADTMSGKRVASSSMTVADYLTYWLHDIARHRVRTSTYVSYEKWIRLHLVPLFGKKKLTALRPNDLRRGFFQLKQTCQWCAQEKDLAREKRAQKERTARAGKPLRKNARKIEGARCCAKVPRECCRSVVSDGTIRYLHRIVRTALQAAVTEEGILAENVAKNLRLKHRYRPRFTSWSAAEARRFLRAASGDRWHAIYAVALMLGLRRGEVLGLQWSDIDLETRTIRVSKMLDRIDGKLQLGPVKTDGSTRDAAIPGPCVDALTRHREQQEAMRREAGKGWVTSDFVFTTSLGTPIEPRNVNRHFAALCDRAEVRRIRFHDLRYSCATLLYELGVPIENIQDVLGHSSPTITKLIYVDGTDKVQRDAADLLGGLFEADDE